MNGENEKRFWFQREASAPIWIWIVVWYGWLMFAIGEVSGWL